MPGAYAHITLVNFAKEPHRLESSRVPLPAIEAVLKYFSICELGAVSPDYPYLHVGRNGSKAWADLMHYERTGEPIKTGIELARDLGDEKQGMLVAWLLGYAAHVAADLTIHPVVELKVGAYAQNKQQHRICEMNQDAHIFQRMNLSDLGRSEHLDTGIWGCCDSPNSGILNQTISSNWRSILSRCYPQQYMDNEPEVDAWHAGFKRAVDLAEEGYRMPLFARHIAVDCGMTYPAIADIESTFIDNLPTPEGPMSYDDIFEKALNNIVSMWAVIGKAVFDGDQSYKTMIENWDLDTGKDANGRLCYWRDTATADHV
jgi:hypothetical protein